MAAELVGLRLLERIWAGDWLLRRLIRHLNRRRLAELAAGGIEAQVARHNALLTVLDSSPRAVCTDQANAQHYEVPSEFFQLLLGPRLKYSCAYWPPGVESLERAEEAMLSLYLERARLQDGQRILDLGCGWGSLCLFLAERLPAASILAVSNSASQRSYIEARARQRGLSNLQVLTCDINHLELPDGEFDRILSIEMLEHVRNYRSVFAMLTRAMKSAGKLFVHIFAHRRFAYLFEPPHQRGVLEGDAVPPRTRKRGVLGGDAVPPRTQKRGVLGGDAVPPRTRKKGAPGWMEREFFAGGTMPSLDLFAYCSAGLQLEASWAVNGLHYQRTAEAWLARLRGARPQIQALFYQVYGRRWRRHWVGWQLFLLACSETFACDRGQEWLVSHQLWRSYR